MFSFRDPGPVVCRFLPVLACLGLLAAASALPQSREMLSHQAWSTEDGLPQDSIHSIAQTSDGFLWAGTEAGLARFDGQQFRVFDQATDPVLKSGDICCMLADKDRGLWIGTRDGLVHHTPAGFAWYGTQDGLPSSGITGLGWSGDGTLLVTTEAGSLRWMGRAMGASAPLTDRAASTTGHWTWTATEVQFHTPAGTSDWRAGHELRSGRIATVLVDREGYAWVGMTQGVAMLDPATGKATEIAAMSGMSVLSAFEDAEGDHWFGTEAAGLHILRRPLFRGVPALAASATTAVVQTADGSMWVGTRDDGLYRVRDGTVDKPVGNRALTSAVILCLQPAADGGLWVGTPDGLIRIAADGRVRRITTSTGLPDDYVRSMKVAADGSLWVGTRHGLDRIDGGRHRVFTSLEGLGGDLIGAIDAGPSAMWVATSGGLSRIAGDGAIRTFTQADGLTSPIVTAMATDKTGRLWVANRDGALAVLEGQRFRTLFYLNRAPGQDRIVQSLTFDGTGSLWVRLDRGIERLRALALDRCLQANACGLPSESMANYSRAEGLRNEEAVASAMGLPWLTPQGELWIPTRAGVAIADLRNLHEDSQGVPVAIEQALVDDTPLEVEGRIPELPWGYHRISIEYAGLDFLSPSSVHYRYRLAGFDPDWQLVGNRRSVAYTNLPPGLYTFHVQARSTDGRWGTAETTFQLRILRPFYQHWWFIAWMLLLAGALLAGAYRLRLRVLRGRFDALLAERNRIAREIHDTLTQDFVSTCLQLDIVAQQLQRGQVDKAIDQVKRARRFVAEGLAEARQSIRELRSEEQRETLPNQLAHLAERETFSALTLHLDVHGRYQPLSARAEREILRLANEALVNVVRHANTTEARLTLRYTRDALMLTVEDRGDGFDGEAAAEQGHFGVMGMRERASVVEGELRIVSSRGNGTTVSLRVPLHALREERRQDA